MTSLQNKSPLDSWKEVQERGKAKISRDNGIVFV